MLNFLGRIKQYIPSSVKHFLKQVGLPPRLVWGLSSSPEPDVCHVIEQIVRPGWVCADVGANIGLITRLLAQLVGPQGQVVSFEAHPQNALLLSKNMTFSGYETRVKVENLAVSDGSIERLWLFPGRSRNSAEWNIVGRDVQGNITSGELEVGATSLDAYFPPNSRLDFVKIDVEGAGLLVLTGMRRLLNSTRPMVLMEFHNEPEWSGRKQLLSAGYVLYDMKGNRLDPPLDSQRVYHCLACPQEKNLPEDTFL